MKLIKKKIDFIIIIGCILVIIFLIFFYNYFTREYKTYNNIVSVTCNKKINIDYELNAKYCLHYDDININYFGKDMYISYMSFLSIDIVKGRNVTNSFEIIVPEKYKDLLNKKIFITINNYKYSFLVVGVYKDKLNNNNFIYTNIETMDILYNKSFDLENYSYIFVVDSYSELNKSLDKLELDNYDVSIRVTNILNDISNYDTISNIIILFINLFLFIIFIFVI